jgi:guanine deaminase
VAELELTDTGGVRLPAGSTEPTESTGPTGPAGDTSWMDMAIALAQSNVEAGGRPFGAVVVLNGTLLATGVNEVVARNDPSAHAEILAMRQACAVLKDISLAEAVLYSSCEPCPMCLAAMRWAELGEVVYGADSRAAARAGFEDRELYELFRLPRESWPMRIRQQKLAHGAEGPLNEWKRREQQESKRAEAGS